MSLNIHYLQHVAFEDLGSMKAVLENGGHHLSVSHLYQPPLFPALDDFDWLIIMGGPMSIGDESTYPWLADEKIFIAQAIKAGKVVIGICLGAQLIAHVLGAKVYKNEAKEIGWFDIQRAPALDSTLLAQALPDKFEAFHWHGDTFDIPDAAIALGESEACQHQGFILDDRVLAFQFHLETTFDSATALVNNCADDIDGSLFVQSAAEMLSNNNRFNNINVIMMRVLNALESK